MRLVEVVLEQLYLVNGVGNSLETPFDLFSEEVFISAKILDDHLKKKTQKYEIYYYHMKEHFNLLQNSP